MICPNRADFMPVTEKNSTGRGASQVHARNLYINRQNAPNNRLVLSSCVGCSIFSSTWTPQPCERMCLQWDYFYSNETTLDMSRVRRVHEAKRP